MEIAIVDDQREYHQIENYRLKKLHYKVNVHSFISIDNLEKSGKVFDLILLDIDMPDINGIEYARNHLEQNIVFVSNYGSCMKSAYGTNVYGFIEKSDSDEEFVAALDNIISIILKNKFIEVKTEQGYRKIFEKDTIYIQYISRKTLLFKMVNGKYIVKGFGLLDFKKDLSENFVVCDRDLIVNVDYIIGLLGNSVLLKGISDRFHVSTRRMQNVKKVYFKRYK